MSEKVYLCSMMYCFNPDHDMALADGRPYYRPPAGIAGMERDLCLLPVWYAPAGSVVKVADEESARRWLAELPLHVPVEVAAECQPVPIVPWGWDPAEVERLRQAGIPNDCCPSPGQLSRIRYLSSRERCIGLQQLLRALPGVRGEAVACTDLHGVLRQVMAYGDALLKSPWSGSGRGLVRVSAASWTANVEGWAARVLRTQGTLMVEPIYNKVRDFAMEFRCGSDGQVRFGGYSLFETDAHGNYKLNQLLPDKAIEERLSRDVPLTLLHTVRQHLAVGLQDLIGSSYTGWLGVDMMVCRGEDGGCWLHPCVEVNLRMNMGVVARSFFDRYVHPAAYGHFQVEYFSADGDALRSDSERKRWAPPVVEDGRLKRGYLSLTPVEAATRYQAFVVVDDAKQGSPEPIL